MDQSGQFNGQPFLASATVTGVLGSPFPDLEGVAPVLQYFAGPLGVGSPLSSAPSQAGTYTAVATFPGSQDYLSSQASVTFSIGQANATIQILNTGGTFSGSPLPATATVTGLDGVPGSTLEGVPLVLNYYSGNNTSATPLSGPPSNAGTYAVLVSFPGSTDYTPNSVTAQFTISPAVPTIDLAIPGDTYTGSAVALDAALTGVDGKATPALEGIGLTISYYPGSTSEGKALARPPVNSGTYTAVASFAGSQDYASNSASITFSIGKATPILTLADASGTFTDSSFLAFASIRGVDGTSGSSLEGVPITTAYYPGSAPDGRPLAAAPVDVGTYTVVTSFPGSQNYNPASTSVTFSIRKAAAALNIVAGGTYSGTPTDVAVTVSGVDQQPAPSLDGSTPTLALFSGAGTTGRKLSSPPTDAGTYTAVATFSSPNYQDATATLTFSINPIPQSITFPCRRRSPSILGRPILSAVWLQVPLGNRSRTLSNPGVQAKGS